jgi:serine/threonine protein kinase
LSLAAYWLCIACVKVNATSDYRIVPDDVRISDFGITRRLDSQSIIPQVLTLRYSAPEVVSHASNIGPPSDVFSFAIVLWELFAGVRAWDGLSDHAIHDAILANRRPSLEPIRALESENDLVLLIANCWRPEPETRPTISQALAIVEARCPVK